MLDEILALPEVSRLLKEAEKTVCAMAEKRGLHAFEVRGRWRINRADLYLWIEDQRSHARDEHSGER